MSALREEFERVYRENVWGGSGGGGCPPVAKPFADIVSRYIAENSVKSVLDIGCGDGWASTLIDLHGAAYLGVDIVEDVIEKCREQHIDRQFLCADALTDSLPAAELVIIKEITQHLGDRHLWSLLFYLSRYPAVLHCSVMPHENVCRVESGFKTRPVNLSIDPFNFPTEPMGTWVSGGTIYHAELWRPRP